jgi:predicted nuclease of predicted toxin-antitoxin system
VKFYLDENLSDKIARAARENGVDVISSHECGRNNLIDAEQLRLAALDGRCLVTGDRDDYVALTWQCMADQTPHAGVLIVAHSLRQSDIGGLVRALIAYHETHLGDHPAYIVDYLRPATGP